MSERIARDEKRRTASLILMTMALCAAKAPFALEVVLHETERVAVAI